jgi:ribonuclease Y
MEWVAFALIGLLIGAVGGYLLGAKKARELNRVEKEQAQQEADRLLGRAREEAEKVEAKAREVAKEDSEKVLVRAREDAQAVLKKAELEARQSAVGLKEKIEEELKEQRKEVKKSEERLEQREAALDKREAALDKREENLDKRSESYDKKEAEFDKRDKALVKKEEQSKLREEQIEAKHREVAETLARVAGMTPDEAKAQLVEQVAQEARLEGARKAKTIEDEAVSDAEKKAKRVLGMAIQRYAGEYVTERTVSVVELPNEDVKGKIIGREGRNIRALEAATGINLIVDDTPEAVILSGFDPVRREVARLALERLISDGRIHPSRIEEVVEKARQEVDKLIKEAGEKASFELGLSGIHPEILLTLGRLRYRTSYGQNIWQHSIEVGFLCGLMASELGLNVKLARRCGLLHDMGKALTHEQEGSHALIGAEIAKKFGENPTVVNAVGAHHEEIPITTIYTHLVMAADALSGARPGARREILESYVRRLEDLERISTGFKGVEKAYAVQAGREIRVMVENTRVTDEEAYLLSKDIARKIEQELTYPGQIKVCVIRETRAVEYAR